MEQSEKRKGEQKKFADELKRRAVQVAVVKQQQQQYQIGGKHNANLRQLYWVSGGASSFGDIKKEIYL